MHRSRAIALAGVLVSAASLALPFVTLTGLGTLGGIEAEAWPVVFPGAVLAGAAILGDRGEPLRPWPAALAGAAALGMAGFVFAKILDARAAVGDAGGGMGMGAWVMAVGTGVALVGVAAGFSRRL